jgi:hypothetical protein
VSLANWRRPVDAGSKARAGVLSVLAVTSCRSVTTGGGRVEAPGFNEGGLVSAVVDLVPQAVGALDDGADGGVDELAGVKRHSLTRH